MCFDSVVSLSAHMRLFPDYQQLQSERRRRELIETQLRLQPYRSASDQPFLSPPIEWKSERRLGYTSSCRIRWLFFPGPNATRSRPFSFFSTATDQHARCRTVSACQEEKGRGRSVIYDCRDDFEEASCYLSFPLTSASSHSYNPGAVGGWRVMVWPGRGHFVIWWKVGKRMWAAEAYKLVLLRCREPLLWSTCF